MCRAGDAGWQAWSPFIFALHSAVVTDSRTLHLRLTRLIVGMIVVLGVLFGPVEQLLPDAHDGDAAATQQGHVTNDGDGTRSAAGGAAPRALPADHQGSPAQAPVHTSHVDHCAHSHALTLGTAVRVEAESVSAPDPYDTASARLESISLAPQQRPPIA